MEDIIIFTTMDSFDADQVAIALKDADIPCYMKKAGAGSYLGVVFGRSMVENIDVYIPAEAEEKAREVLADMGYGETDWGEEET